MAEAESSAIVPATISVGDLAAHLLRAGDLTSEYRGAKRAIDGIRLHQQIQSQRPAGYQAEVPVSYTATFGTIRLTLSGRVDGILHPDEGPVIIEEIKSAYGDVTEMTGYRAEHWGQLQCYGFIYAEQYALSEVCLQLTYAQIGSMHQKQFQEVVSCKILSDRVHDWMARYAEWLSRVWAWRENRNQSIRGLGFPFPAYRPGQRNMAVAVYRTLQASGQTFIQAPTGIGKTMAAVFPAIKAMPEGLADRFFYLTARTTGRTVAEAALQRLRQKGLRFKSLSLTAKEKICLQSTPDCGAAVCAYAHGHFDRIDQARWQIFEHDDFSASLLQEIARHHRVCPFELSVELARWMDALIGDYNYVFDPRVSLKSLWHEALGPMVFLVDEAHNLVDRSREMYSAELYGQAFKALAADLGTALPHLRQVIDGILDRLDALGARPRHDGSVRWHAGPPHEDFTNLLIRFVVLADHWLSRNTAGDFYEALITLYFQVHTFLKIIESYDAGYLTYDETAPDDIRIKLWCVDPAAQMASVLGQARATVFFSATLTPWTFFQRAFGCRQDAVGIHLPSPFPEEHLAVLAMTPISTRYKERALTRHAVGQAILTFIARKPGNYIVFLPSYTYLEMVRETLQTLAPQRNLLVQEPGMDEAQRTAFLDEFEASRTQPVTALAVMGGIFGEGIDLRGERLSGAVIVGVGLPGISPERQKMRDYYQAHDGSGFEFAYAFPGMTRVLQAAGRVIRSARDTGAVLLIDDRYGRPPYRHLLPDHWCPQWIASHTQLETRLTQFWQSLGKNSGDAPPGLERTTPEQTSSI